MRVDGIRSNYPLLHAFSSLSFEPRIDGASTSSQASVSGHAPGPWSLNHGQYDQDESEEKSGDFMDI